MTEGCNTLFALPAIASDAVLPSMQSKRGMASELLAAHRLLTLGFDVARPLVDDCGVDLVLWGVGRAVTVQVKSACEAVVAESTRRQHRFHVFQNPKRRWLADLYLLHGFVAEGDGLWWVVPSARLLAVTPGASLSLYPGASGKSAALSDCLGAWHLVGETLDAA